MWDVRIRRELFLTYACVRLLYRANANYDLHLRKVFKSI